MSKLRIQADSPLLQKYNKVFSLFAAFYYLIFLYCLVEHRYFGSVYQTALFRIVIVLLVVSYFVIYRFQGGIELHLLALYCLWAIITRIIHGEVLQRWEFLVELQLMLVWFIPGIILCREKRDRYYNWLVWITVIFFSLLGLLCIYAGATRGWIINPLTGEGTGYPNYAFWRLHLFSIHPNGTAGLFLISFCLSLTLIFRTKTSAGKIVPVLTAFIAYVVIALTISRNAQTFASAALGLMAGILVLCRMKAGQKTAVRVAVLLGVTLAVLLASYRLYEPIRKVMWQVYEGTKAVSAEESVQTKAGTRSAGYELKMLSSSADSEESDAEESFQEDTRDYLDSGRKEIYWSGLKSLQMDPKRIFCGAPMDEVMDISNSLIEEQATNFHNCFLHVVNEFGLPALILVVAFFLKMFIDGMAVILKEDSALRLQDRMLVLPVAALMGFNMLEATSFVFSDFLSCFFFFACGMLTGVYREKKE